MKLAFGSQLQLALFQMPNSTIPPKAIKPASGSLIPSFAMEGVAGGVGMLASNL